ncbi:MAG: hypothetical protein JXR05_08420 [Flavobacteriaceae bacterium]
MNIKFLIVSLFLILSLDSYSQQVSDTGFNPEIKNPAYDSGKGSVVFIDEGHHNFHTKEGRYKSFSNLLERDGYKVLPYKGTFKKTELANGKILVISNALNKRNVGDWSLPNPSAFTKEEIQIVKKWIYEGGSLFLIADHMPMAGAATDLAKEFGFEFTNGFALDSLQRGPSIFNLKEKTLHMSSITSGRNANESVHQIATFTGQGFKIPSDATPILTFDDKHVNLLPSKAWVFTKGTPNHNLKGWFQGAFKKYGKGRIVVSGEAAMFTAQIAGPNKVKMGMNNKAATQNYQLLLNIIHWLDGVIE